MKKLITIHLLTIIGFGAYACSNLQYQETQTPNDNFEIHGVDSKLVQAIIHVESSGRPHVISKCGAIGLMQIMPINLKTCGITKDQLFDPHHNIKCGTIILKDYLKLENNNLRNALARYNGGWRKPKQSYQYADKVLNLFKKLV